MVTFATCGLLITTLDLFNRVVQLVREWIKQRKKWKRISIISKFRNRNLFKKKKFKDDEDNNHSEDSTERNYIPMSPSTDQLKSDPYLLNPLLDQYHSGNDLIINHYYPEESQDSTYFEPLENSIEPIDTTLTNTTLADTTPALDVYPVFNPTLIIAENKILSEPIVTISPHSYDSETLKETQEEDRISRMINQACNNVTQLSHQSYVESKPHYSSSHSLILSPPHDQIINNCTLSLSETNIAVHKALAVQGLRHRKIINSE
jgi:hypothetical protein